MWRSGNISSSLLSYFIHLACCILFLIRFFPKQGCPAIRRSRWRSSCVGICCPLLFGTFCFPLHTSLISLFLFLSINGYPPVFGRIYIFAIPSVLLLEYCLPCFFNRRFHACPVWYNPCIQAQVLLLKIACFNACAIVLLFVTLFLTSFTKLLSLVSSTPK